MIQAGSTAARGAAMTITKESVSKALMARRRIMDVGHRGMASRMASRMASSSGAIIGDLLPDSVKEAVKTSVLDEISRKESKLWGDKASESAVDRTVNGQLGLRTKGDTKLGSSATPQDGERNGFNTPISPSRLQMLHDPLDEWYLDVKPSSSPFKPTTPGSSDPFKLAQADLNTLTEGIRRDLIGSDHPVLAKAASYFFQDGHDGGKKIRPMMVLLISRAMALHTTTTNNNHNHNHKSSPPQSPPQSSQYHTPTPQTCQRPDLFQSQQRLAEISEMIHTASLFHDDVIDGADTRRGEPSVHRVFGNKVAILAGDYLLARASVFLARLRDVEVVETMSTIIEHLVRGEVMQMKGNVSLHSSNHHHHHQQHHQQQIQQQQQQNLIYYLQKNFYKTASLMANSCKSAAILGNYDDTIISAAYRYGKHLGIAFQLVDDVLDFNGSATIMGKPALSDLNAGLATAPVLFAAEAFPEEMGPLMDRKFREEGDVERAVELVGLSDGIERTVDLARVHVEVAIDAVLELDQSVYRDSLVHLGHLVLERTH